MTDGGAHRAVQGGAAIGTGFVDLLGATGAEAVELLRGDVTGVTDAYADPHASVAPPLVALRRN